MHLHCAKQLCIIPLGQRISTNFLAYFDLFFVLRHPSTFSLLCRHTELIKYHSCVESNFLGITLVYGKKQHNKSYYESGTYREEDAFTSHVLFK